MSLAPDLHLNAARIDLTGDQSGNFRRPIMMYTSLERTRISFRSGTAPILVNSRTHDRRYTLLLAVDDSRDTASGSGLA